MTARMPETPHHISSKIDTILDRLNAQWDLQLPRLHGEDARRAESEVNVDARRCAARIRFLCYRSSVDIDSVIAEFEENANHVSSKWVYKPGQEKGTLLRMPVTKSFLKRDVMSRKPKHITEDLRNALLKNLSRILDDDYSLARDSDAYERTPSQSVSAATSRSTSFATAVTDASSLPIPSKMLTPFKQPSKPDSTSSKRRKVSDQIHLDRRTRTRYHPTTLDNFLQKPVKNPPTTVSEVDTPENINTEVKTDEKDANVFTSFTTDSSDPASVFSRLIGQSSASSNDTWRLSGDSHKFDDDIPIQDWEDMLKDKSFSSLLDITVSEQAFSIGNHQILSPFIKTEPLPADLHFWLRWEIHRVALHVNTSPQDLLAEVKKDYGTTTPNYEQFWSTIRRISRSQNAFMPPKSDARLWVEAKDVYTTSDGKTASFSAKLDYTEKAGYHLWNLSLNPINIDKGNRIHRKFGSDRHLVVSLNHFDKNALPSWAREQRRFDPDAVYTAIVKWLTRTEHEIAGRSWRAFYLEPEKTQNRSRRAKEGSRLKLHLFATDTRDLDDNNGTKLFSIVDFFKWHIPFKNNLESNHLKLFSRCGLALSKTQSSVTLDPSQFRYLPDEEIVMNDGCALMSLSLAKSIWEVCGDGTNDIPTAFQARIGGAKGLWVLDYRSGNLHGDASSHWIEVSDSQLKIHPHPRDRHDADETQRTFEVLKYSTPCKPGRLNTQLINILADRGVPRLTLREIVLNDIKEYIEASWAATEDPREFRAWLEQYHKIDRSDASSGFDSNLPATKVETMCMFVDGGFTFQSCEPLRDGMKFLMEQNLDTYVEKLKIELPFSTSVFCVPDPYKCLEENEVYIGFSNSWENPKTGLKETILENVDVLVARNPAHLASDIQKRKAVYKHELRNFVDVIVFPTKGKVPLASLLSGGDYDGDTVTVIWDPMLTEPFQCVEKPELPDEAKCGLVKASRKMRDMIRGESPSAADIDNFLESCFFFNAQPSRLGICTNRHETLVYNGHKLTDPGPIMLAALAGYLVDANKQGLSQTERSWNEICKKTSGGRHLAGLAYKGGQDQPRRNSKNECINIMDHLKFDVAMGKKDEILSAFNKMVRDAPKWQGELAEMYKQEDARTEKATDPEKKEVKLILDDLNQKIDTVSDAWDKGVRLRANKTQGRDFATATNQILLMVQQIQPLALECNLYRDFVRDEVTREGSALGSNSGTRWSLLRASAMYYRLRYRNRDLVWRVVGPELARIKARHGGYTHEMTPEIHGIMKTDLKKVKRLRVKGHDESDSEDDER